MSCYQWLCILGVPTLVGIVIKYIQSRFEDMKKRQDTHEKDLESMRFGIQALLRAQMIADYNHYIEQGWAPIYAKENFNNMYTRYHELGANGVMTDLYDRFMKLPTGRDVETA